MDEPAGPVEPGPRLPIRLKRGTRLPRLGWGPLVALLGMIVLLAGYEYTQTLLPDAETRSGANGLHLQEHLGRSVPRLRHPRVP